MTHSEAPQRPVAVVTGASSGIGAATARALAAAGYEVVVGARRVERVTALAEEIGGRGYALDVADAESVAAFVTQVGRCDVLVNNAGGALGAHSVAEADLEAWRSMYEVNVLGLVAMTKALLPALLDSGLGHVINIGSVAGREVYEGGGGYNAAKHAVSALTRVMRLELLGQPVRITQLDPGMVETEFALTRFGGDEEKAAAVYEGMEPMQAADIAEAVVWVVSRPRRVNVDSMLIMATDQSTAKTVHRR